MGLRPFCCMGGRSGVGGAIGVVAGLEPALQLLDPVVVPREVLLLHIPRQLIAELGVHGGVEQTGVLIGGEAIAELTDGAGVDKGPLEPAGRKLGKLRVHGDPSFLES